MPGFTPCRTVTGVDGDPYARVITLMRRAKTICGTCGTPRRTWYDRRPRRVRDIPCGDLRIYLAFALRRVDCHRCGGVTQERLDWHAVKEMDKLSMRE